MARHATAALALLFLALHVPFLPPTLEDVDSINFALGVADYDVSRHQPHPPGYPVFIGLAKVATAALRAAGVPSPEPRGLAIWSAISGAALVLLLWGLFQALERTRAGGASISREVAGWATLVAVASPLFWFTALRPLSDTTGLAVAIAAQALIVSVMTGAAGPRALVGAALLAGLAVGVRSQTVLLTGPLLGVALLTPRRGVYARDRIAAISAGAIGVLAWGIPLIVLSGGLSGYAAALGAQAGEDFSGVVMLWTDRRARVALDALMYSFVWPWGHPVAGAVVIATALIGAGRLLWKAPRTLALLLLAFGPYAVFHLVFQETITIRYALPIVVPMAYLAICALEWGGAAVVSGGALALVAWSLLISIPATVWYGGHGSPAFTALRDAELAADARSGPIGLHAVARRATDWLARDRPLRVLKAPSGREWLSLVQEWRTAPASAIVFVADPRRTDLALFDPQSRQPPARYRWGFTETPFVSGIRPGDSDLYLLAPPGWMLDRGWALTAEVAGVTAKDGLGPHRKPSVAWVRARPDSATLMIGGRHLGAATDTAVRISMTLNGKPLEPFEVKPGFFFRRVSLPAGSLAGESAYMPLDVASAPADGSNRILPIGLEQFDLQSPSTPMIGAADGWYEPEYDPRTARAWRWTAETATLWLQPIGRDVTLTLSGESPLRYFDAAPAVTVTVAGREIARFRPDADFNWDVVLPAGALAAADGRVVIATDKFFVPAAHGGLGDQRHLSLRIYSYSVR